MFVVSEADRAEIHRAFKEGGEEAAIAAVRRLFPFASNEEVARRWAHTIMGWRYEPSKRGGGRLQ